MKRFRLNVLAVLTDDARENVLVFRRVETHSAEHRWQFPQGGLEPGETPEQGLLRELKEEIGTANVEIIARVPHPIRYEFPPEILASLSRLHPGKAGNAGQEQYWFLARIREGGQAINFEHQPREFDAYKWVPPEEAVELVVPFKKEAYLRGLNALGLLPRS